MRNRLLKSVLALAAVCLPTLAMAQQPQDPIHREGSWEFSLGGGIMVLDPVLRDFLGSGAPETRFATSASPTRIPPTAVVRVGYNFTPNWGLSASGGVAIGASGVRYWTPTAALTYTVDLNAMFSPFVLIGTELTRIEGDNSRVTHSVWGAHAGLGVRQMIGEDVALRLEGRMQVEHYHEVPMRKATVFNPVVTLGVSFFVGGRRPLYFPTATVFLPGTVIVDTLVRTRLDTAWVSRVDTVRGIVYVMEPSVDQLILRVQFETDSTIILPLSRPVLDTVAMAIIATPGSRWDVTGHTDNVGDREHNQTLSQGRAQAVLDYLVSRGVDRSILEATGYGEDRPVVSNDTEAGRAQNRRVQLRRRPSGAYVVPIP
jgi:outer membrane protein OmpA-like peptidoglycan-associated protein/opacity protein-like surface antigen